MTNIAPTNGKQAGGGIGSIIGSGFLPGATVTVGGAQAADVGITSNLITLRMPPGAEGLADVVVTNPDGQKGILRGGYTYNPFPVIEEMQPEYGGPLAGGTEVIITGSNFMQGVTVSIGNERVPRLDFFSPTELRLKTPPGEAGLKAVTVVNPDGQPAVQEDGFSYNPVPRITSVKPDAGPLEGGIEITITGTGFIGAGSGRGGIDVLVGGVEAPGASAWSSTRVTVDTPPSTAGVKDVVVINRDGQEAKLRDGFTYNPAPVINSVTPNNGKLAGGTQIVIQGSGFLPEAKVLMAQDVDASSFIVAQLLEVSPTSIIAITPPGKPGSKDIMVRNTDLQHVSRRGGFTYNEMPKIMSLSVNHGPTSGGTKVIINGSGFLPGAQVLIGESVATSTVKGTNTIEAFTPKTTQGVWDVRVINPDTQEAVLPKGFTTVGEVAYNYPNPFRAAQGTTFRYVTNEPLDSITVKVFNVAGVPIDIVQGTGTNEVRWHNTSIHAGLYVYRMEVQLADGKEKQFRNMLEVYK